MEGRVNMEYISAPEAAKKWAISERRVQKLCEENRIWGVPVLVECAYSKIRGKVR